MTSPQPRTAAGRALLEALSNLAADLPLEFGDEPLERLDIVATLGVILAIEAEAAAPDPAPEPTKWEWHGDWPVGVRHGAGDGWLHVHPDGTRWVHPEKVCDAAAPDPVASPLDADLIAKVVSDHTFIPGWGCCLCGEWRSGIPAGPLAAHVADKIVERLAAEEPSR